MTLIANNLKLSLSARVIAGQVIDFRIHFLNHLLPDGAFFTRIDALDDVRSVLISTYFLFRSMAIFLSIQVKTFN